MHHALTPIGCTYGTAGQLLQPSSSSSGNAYGVMRKPQLLLLFTNALFINRRSCTVFGCAHVARADENATITTTTIIDRGMYLRHVPASPQFYPRSGPQQ
jgi:hypothetical protein